MIAFPSSPVANDTYTAGGRTWKYNGTVWQLQPTPVSYADLTNVPSTFAPTAHQHEIADVNGLQTALDGKQAAGSYATLVGGVVPASQLPGFVDDVVIGISDVTDLQTALDAKQIKTVYADAAPAHAAGLEWVDTTDLRSYRSYNGAWIEIDRA
jgi:hypothetical protein